MFNKEDDQAKFQEFRLFCKQVWNTRDSPEYFINHLKEVYTKKDIESFFFNFLQAGLNLRKLDLSVDNYILSIIADDPSVIFANVDLSNPEIVLDLQEFIKVCKMDIFNTLPVNSEKSANTVLNVLIISLMNDNKAEMQKSVLKIAQSTYFSILLSSGRIFCFEKYKRAQELFKLNDPFDCPPFQLPITQIHLVLALFPDYLMIPFHYHDKFKLSFFVFAVFQLIVLDCSDIKILITDSTLASVYSSFLNFFLVQPTYSLSYFLNTFPKKHFNSKNIIKVNDFYSIDNDIDYSSYSLYYDNPEQAIRSKSNLKNKSDDNLEKILHFFYDSSNQNHQKQDGFYDDNIIHDQLPNGILPTYEQALDFLLRKPESININTIIEDALRYPSFTPEIANIFMSSLKNKDYQTATILANQILDKIDDIRIAWIEQFVFFPILNALHECLNEIYDEYQFEVLFFLFISFFEGCARQGEIVITNSLHKFISKMDEPFRLFLSNFLSGNDFKTCRCEINEEKPIKKLINFLDDCKTNNDIDLVEMMKYPYLIFSGFIWGFKTIHPNSVKLLSIKIPKYKILRRFFVYLSTCHQNKKDPFIEGSSNLIYAIRTSYCSFDLLTRFPPMDESGIRIIILQHLQKISNPRTKTEHFQGIVISWRAWMKIFSIEKFVIIIIETLIMESNNFFDQDKIRYFFLIAERILTNVFLNSHKTKVCFSVDNLINFNTETNKFENIYENVDLADFEKKNIKIDDSLKAALWTALEFVNNYDGSYSDGIGIASFCVLLSLSIKNDWKSEFKKVIDFSDKMMKESNWKSLKYSFGANISYISMAILDVYKLIDIDKYDFEYFQINWKFGIIYFFIQSEIKRLKELKLISPD